MTRKRKPNNKKRGGSAVTVFIAILLPLVFFLFGFLFLQTEIKFLHKEIYQKEKNVEILQNQLEAKLVDVQKLQTEDRIVGIAKSQLGMVRIKSSVENLFVDKLKIEQIKRIVDSKYE